MRGRKPNLTLVESAESQGRCPPFPSWFSKFAREEWKRVAPELHKRGSLTEDTKGTVESYCVAAGMARECEEAMNRDGRIVYSENFPPSVHPAFKIWQSSVREARLLACELGITPHRRPKADKSDDGDLAGLDL